MRNECLWLIALHGAIVGLAGCAPKAVPHNIAFDERELLPYASAAKGSLAGQAFQKTAGGDVKFAAGELVELIPATRWVQEWWEVEFVGGRPLIESPEARAKLDARSHVTRADGTGNFEFADVPAGDYYVIIKCKLVRPELWPTGREVRTEGDGASRAADKDHPDALMRARVGTTFDRCKAAMPLNIPDNVLAELRAKAPDTLVELACRLYTADEISKPQATRLAGLERIDFEAELTKRGLP